MFQYSKLCTVVGLSAAVAVGVVFSYWFQIKKKRSQRRNNSTSKLLCEACKASLEAEMLHSNCRMPSSKKMIGKNLSNNEFFLMNCFKTCNKVNALFWNF